MQVKIHVSEIVNASINVLIGIGFWSASLTYLALSLVKFMAIKKPLVYRRKVTSKLILKVLLAFWPLAIFMETISPNLYFLINQNVTCMQYDNGPVTVINAVTHEFFFLLVLATCAIVAQEWRTRIKQNDE